MDGGSPASGMCKDPQRSQGLQKHSVHWAESGGTCKDIVEADSALEKRSPSAPNGGVDGSPHCHAPYAAQDERRVLQRGEPQQVVAGTAHKG